METPYDGGKEVCSNGSGHMTKMAAMPIYGKTPFKNLLLANQKADDLGTLYVASGIVGPTKFVQMMILD